MPYLKTENLKNHTLFRGTYLYSPYMGVPPAPGEKADLTAPCTLGPCSNISKAISARAGNTLLNKYLNTFNIESSGDYR